MYQLYYYPGNASTAPHFILEHLNLSYELLLVDKENVQQRSADYLKLNPTGRIPVLVDKGQALFESAAICIYLCEQHTEKELIPTSSSIERGRFFQWMMFLTNTLQAELMVYYYPHRHVSQKEAVPQLRLAQQQQISQALNVINQQLEGRDYLLGTSLTACDFFLFMLCEWSLPIQKNPMDYPNLANYLRKMAQHPTICKVCKTENIDLTPFHPL